MRGLLSIEGPHSSGTEVCLRHFRIADTAEVPSIGEGTKTPCAAHRIDQRSPNFGRSVERLSLTGVIILHEPDR